MKQWLETQQVLDRLSALTGPGGRAALATVVRVRGSAYRREGAKMLVSADGASVGNVSGGCLEADVREVALQVLGSGVAQVRAYCSGTDEVSAWDLGVGCEGQVEILVEPVAGSRDAERALLDRHLPFAVCTLLPEGAAGAPGGRLVVTDGEAAGGLGSPALDRAAAARARALLDGGRSGVHEVEGRAVFIDVFEPPPHLVIVGAGDDARPLARIALEVGFRVTVADRRAALLDGERFPARVGRVHTAAGSLADRVPLDERCCVVVMTHSYADDLEALRALLDTPVSYIGMLGPRQRTERMLDALRAERPVDEGRVFGPVGLDIGAEGSEQVALAVVAELLAVRSGRRGGPLRERRQPIHAAVG